MTSAKYDLKNPTMTKVIELATEEGSTHRTALLKFKADLKLSSPEKTLVSRLLAGSAFGKAFDKIWKGSEDEEENEFSED